MARLSMRGPPPGGLKYLYPAVSWGFRVGRGMQEMLPRRVLRWREGRWSGESTACLGTPVQSRWRTEHDGDREDEPGCKKGLSDTIRMGLMFSEQLASDAGC